MQHEEKFILLVRPVNVTQELRALRDRAGLSQAEMARRLGYQTQSGYQRYEDATQYTKPYLRQELIEKLIPILVGLGTPPIAKDQVFRLGGAFIQGDEAFEIAVNEVIAGSNNNKNRIPILRWEQIMAWTRKQLLPLEIERYTDASHDDPGPDAFVVPIVNNCMSPDGIFEGDKVVCDPSKPYNPGSIVIAEVAGEDVPVIGRYRLRRSRTGNLITEISPSNDAFPQHFIDAERPGSVVGRVVEHRKKL